MCCVLEQHTLDAKAHTHAGFDCGEPLLNDYLRRYAVQQAGKGVASTFVVADSSQSSKILGFYSLSAAQIDVQQLGNAERARLSRYPVPCFRMGRLAGSLEALGTDMGEVLMGLAVDRCLKAKAHVGAYALLVDAKHAQAKIFYERYGFIACVDAPLTLYLRLGRWWVVASGSSTLANGCCRPRAADWAAAGSVDTALSF